MFWNKIAEWLKSLGIPYISQLVVMLILLAAILVVLFIIWLIFRKARLWYWKTDIQIDTLKSIDVRLHNVEETLSINANRIIEKNNDEALTPDGIETISETFHEIIEPEGKGLVAVGKSGKIYTEAELELQIRD